MVAHRYQCPEIFSQRESLPFVLCVDDDTEVLASLERALRKEPYHYGLFSDPEQAIDCVRKRFVDLILVDYRMRGMSGTSLLQVVKAASPATVRVMLTGDPENSWIRAAEERGLMSVCGKPWKDVDLRNLIRSRIGAYGEGA